MGLGFRLKHHFFSAFRELFVHHHGSLEFRAKIFALLIATNKNEDEDITDKKYAVINDIGLDIYKGDDDRANLLVLSTKELVKKVYDDNGLDIDTLVSNIQAELKIIYQIQKNQLLTKYQ